MSRITIIPMIILILAVSNVHGQDTKSVVRLKNGVVLKGEIVEFVQDDYMLMKIMDGQDMRIPVDYVTSFKIKKGKLSIYNLPEPGYYNYTLGGFIFLKGNQFDWVEVNMSLHTINGYRFDQRHSAGIGVGLDRYGAITSLPVYLSLRREFNPRRVSPLLNGNVGYGLMWESESYDSWQDYDNVKGGLYWEIGAGLRVNYNKTALIFNYAYKRQNSELTYTNNDWWRLEDTIVEKRSFRNMTLTVGLEF